MGENTIYPCTQKCGNITVNYDAEGKPTLTNAAGQTDMTQNYIKQLEQRIEILKQELKVVKGDRDMKAQIALNMEACAIDIYKNVKTLEEAKDIVSKYLHDTVLDAFKKL